MKTIWLLEDIDLVAELTADLLRIHGYQVVAMTHGQDMIDALRSMAPDPDLLIVDLVMTEPDGYDAIAVARQHRPNVPVLVMSGAANCASPEVQAYCKGLVLKPYTLEVLLAAVSSATRTNEGR